MEQTATERHAGWVIAGIVTAGSAVAVLLGVVGERIGEPRVLETYGFSSVQSFKAWLATAVLGLVGFQLLSAVWMYGWIPRIRSAPRWLHRLHRASGVSAVLISLPVAYYCLYGFGFDDTTDRALAHSIAGCAFYGAFVAKMLALRSRRAPAWLLPALGGLTFSVFVVAWWTAAWWWFELVGWIR